MLEQAGLVLAAEVRTDYDRTMPQGLVLGTYYPRSYAAPGGTVEVVVSKGPYDWSSNPGNGTAARPFQIQTASQLDSLTDHPELWSKSFLLTTDIDMAGRQYSKALIAPDVNDTTEGFQGTAFTGSFDGQWLQDPEPEIATKTNDYLGLFGYHCQRGHGQEGEPGKRPDKGGTGVRLRRHDGRVQRRDHRRLLCHWGGERA